MSLKELRESKRFLVNQSESELASVSASESKCDLLSFIQFLGVGVSLGGSDGIKSSPRESKRVPVNVLSNYN